MSQENVELVLRGYRAFLAGDLATIAEMLDPAVEWHGLDRWGCADHNEVLRVVAERIEEGFRVELERCVGLGDEVVVSFRAAGVEADAADERPLQTRRYFTVGRYSAVITIRDSRVSRVQDYPHISAALAAVGIEEDAT